MLDVDFLDQPLSVDEMPYQFHEGSVLVSRPDSIDPHKRGFVGSFEHCPQLSEYRSYSSSTLSSQSMSPQTNIIADTSIIRLSPVAFGDCQDQLSPPYTGVSRKESDDESQRAEVS